MPIRLAFRDHGRRASAATGVHRPGASGGATRGVVCRCLDPGIAPAVKILWENGIDPYESCEGGPGHAFAQPTIRFHGGEAEAAKAAEIARANGLDVRDLRPVPLGGQGRGGWEITFRVTR